MLKTTFSIAVAILSISNLFSQELFVGNTGEFYLEPGVVFTTSNTVVTTGTSGVFSVGAGSNWGANQEYVNGKVTAYGSGITVLPTGNDGIYAPVTANHSGDVEGIYYHASPFTGSLGTDVDATSELEYWELSGNAIITLPWKAHSDMSTLVSSNGGSINSIAIVGLNGSTWDLVSAPQTNTVTGTLTEGTVTSDNTTEVNLNGFSQFTFGIDHQVVLDVDDLFLNKEIVLLNNPVQQHSDILFKVATISEGLNLTIFDVNGRTLQHHSNMKLSNGTGKISSVRLASGIYMLKFEHEGKMGIKKLIIE